MGGATANCGVADLEEACASLSAKARESFPVDAASDPVEARELLPVDAAAESATAREPPPVDAASERSCQSTSDLLVKERVANASQMFSFRFRLERDTARLASVISAAASNACSNATGTSSADAEVAAIGSTIAIDLLDNAAVES